MRIFRLALLIGVIWYIKRALIPDICSDLSFKAFKCFASVVRDRVRQLDRKYDLLETSQAAIAAAFDDPSSTHGKRVLVASTFSFGFGLHLRRPLLGVMLAFASTFADFGGNGGFAADVAEVVEDVANAAWWCFDMIWDCVFHCHEYGGEYYCSSSLLPRECPYGWKEKCIW